MRRPLDYTKEQINSLPDKERTVIIYYYALGLSNKAIAADLKISTDRVNQIKRKALKRLALGNPHHDKVDIEQDILKPTFVWVVVSKLDFYNGGDSADQEIYLFHSHTKALDFAKKCYDHWHKVAEDEGRTFVEDLQDIDGDAQCYYIRDDKEFFYACWVEAKEIL